MREWTCAPGGLAEDPDSRELAPPAEVRELVQRLDWRFLLPDPDLKRVAYLGRRDDLLATALERFADAFLPVDANGEPPAGDPGPRDSDLAVVASRRVEDLRTAISRLRPGGHLYWELDRRPPLPGGGRAPREKPKLGDGRFLRDPRPVLESLGMTGVRFGWAFPDFRRAKVFLSPDPVALHFAIGMRGLRIPGLGAVLRLCARLCPLPRVLPTLCVIARRPGGEGDPRGNAAAALLGERASRSSVERLPWILVSRRAASFAVTMLLDSDTGEPTAVVKAVRIPGDRRSEEALARERTGLSAAADARLPEPSSVPSVLAWSEAGNGRQLAISGVPGRTLRRRDFLRISDARIERILRWLMDLHRASSRPDGGGDERYERLVERPLRTLSHRLAFYEGSRESIRSARPVAERLRAIDLPIVIEHGDFCGSNILLTREGSVSVVDWELAEPDGFPGTDLFFFLASLALAREDARSWDEKLDALRKAFWGPDGWALGWISSYWDELELPPEAFQPLFLCSWTRWVAGLLRRPDKSLVTAQGEGVDRPLTRHHHFRFWRELAEASRASEPFASVAGGFGRP